MCMNAKDTFFQICRERFGMNSNEEMQMYLRHLEPGLTNKFHASFRKKRKGSKKKAV